MTSITFTRKVLVRDPAALPAWRVGMSPWQWKHLPTTKISSVTPLVKPTGALGNRIDAYNGMAVDRVTSRCFLAGMGGHGDYWGNEAYSIDFRDDAPAWQILREPTPAAYYAYDQPYYLAEPDGKQRPTSRHCYWSLNYLPALDRVFRIGAGGYAGSGQVNGPEVDAFSLVAGDWDPPGTWENYDLSSDSGSKTCCQDHVTNDVYVFTRNGVPVRYSGATGAKTTLAASGSSFWRKTVSAVDTSRNRLLVAGKEGSPSKCKFYDIASNTWGADVTATGPTSAEPWGGRSLEYVPSIDRFVKKTLVGGEVILVHPETLVCTSQPVTGDTLPDAPDSAIWSRFRYLPALGGFVYYPLEKLVTTGMFFLALE